MKRIVALALLAAISAIAACNSGNQAPDNRQPPPVGLPEADSDVPSRYARFYGVWSGKWDDYWDVTFVIAEIDDDGSIHGDYYWKENIRGPWSHQSLDGHIEGNSLQLGVIRVDLDSEISDIATAYGDFPTDRTARLRKLRTI